MKTKPFAHQAEAFRRAGDKEYFGHFMEMGTGKTWVTLAEAEDKFKRGKIETMAVVAPKGVHTNWVLREIPAHLSIDTISEYYVAGAGKKATAKMERVFHPTPYGVPTRLRVFTINVDALRTPKGFEVFARFVRSGRCLLVIDESIRIKNVKSTTTKKAYALADLAAFRRILNGTPTGGTPIDLFGQMEFLEPGLLGTSSLRAFTSEFADVLPDDNPLVKNIVRKIPPRVLAYSGIPQVIAEDEDGNPKWRNLDKLRALMAPHVFRVLKKDCLDLPPKVFKRRYFDLTPAQAKAYTLMQEKCRIEFGDDFLAVAPAARIMKLQQLTSGFVMIEGAAHLVEIEENPRMALLRSALETAPGKVIVWCRFKEELRQAAAICEALGRKPVMYFGEVRKEDRETAVDSFQNGDADTFIGQQQSGGIGLTLTAADLVIYVSNDYNLTTRQQSEDRAHRIGQKKTVVYLDLLANETIDVAILDRLAKKANVATEISDL